MRNQKSMKIVKNETHGIILEGGAMRSVFSAGVLDFFLEKGIEIPNVLSVSAGSYAGMNYVSRQKGRIVDSVIMPLKEYKYLGFSTFFKKGTFFDMDYLFDEVPKKKAPYDFQKLKEHKGRFITSVVNCHSGENIYYENFDSEEKFFQVCKAANSLPLIAKISYIDDKPLLDGGMADAIPIDKAIEEGWNKIIVVFTRDASYRKTNRSNLYTKSIRVVYRKYPQFLKLIQNRPERYNDSLEKVSKLEKEGKAFVLRPTKITVGNNESNVDKLMQYYQHGYDTASQRYEELLQFLNT